MNSFTTPGFADEKQAAESFDEIVQASGLFRSYHEVRGRLIQPRYHQEDKDVRIDRILIPTAKLAGWAAGWIGVEFKRSDTKIGRPLSQIADYTRALFELPPVNGLIQPSWFFLWPAEKEAGDLASWMAQQRIGTAMPSVRFSTGEVTVLSFWRLVSSSIWHGIESDPKTEKSKAPIPVIPRLAKMLEAHRVRIGNPIGGPIFPNGNGKPICLDAVARRIIIPALNVCGVCSRTESDHGRIHDHCPGGLDGMDSAGDWALCSTLWVWTITPFNPFSGMRTLKPRRRFILRT